MRYHSCPKEKVARNYGGSKLGAHSVPTPHSNFPMQIIPSNFHPALSSLGGGYIPIYSFLMRYHAWPKAKVARNYGGAKLECP